MASGFDLYTIALAVGVTAVFGLFFWLVGFGVVVGAALNAALAVVPEEGAIDAGASESEQ